MDNFERLLSHIFVKPKAYYLIIGLVWLYSCPDHVQFDKGFFDIKWLGYILISCGVCGFIVWFINSVLKPFVEKKNAEQRTEEIINLLNQKEREILRDQINKGEQTFYYNSESDGNYQDNVYHYMRVCRGLERKGFLSIVQGSVNTIQINNSMWQILKRKLVTEASSRPATSGNVKTSGLKRKWFCIF